MRTIKFRGKRLLSEDWEYGNLIQRPDGGNFIETGDMRLCPMQDFSIGQFTGLYDKNGKEIYEGDIIRSFDSKGEPIIHYIIYDDEEAGFVVILKGSAKGDFGYGRCCQQWITECEEEVIGNIHDNPELLKGK